MLLRLCVLLVCSSSSTVRAVDGSSLTEIKSMFEQALAKQEEKHLKHVAALQAEHRKELEGLMGKAHRGREPLFGSKGSPSTCLITDLTAGTTWLGPATFFDGTSQTEYEATYTLQSVSFFGHLTRHAHGYIHQRYGDLGGEADLFFLLVDDPITGVLTLRVHEPPEEHNMDQGAFDSKDEAQNEHEEIPTISIYELGPACELFAVYAAPPDLYSSELHYSVSLLQLQRV